MEINGQDSPLKVTITPQPLFSKLKIPAIFLGAILFIALMMVVFFRLTKNTPQPPSTTTGNLLTGTILYLDSENILQSLNLQNNRTSFLIPRDKLAENNIKVINSVLPSPNYKKLLIHAYFSEDSLLKAENSMFFVSVIDGSNLTRLDTNKISTLLKFTGDLEIKNWAYQKNSLVFTLTNRVNKKNPQTIIGEYNLDDGTVSELAKIPGADIKIQLYDPTKQKLLFFSSDSNLIQEVNTSTQAKKSGVIYSNITNLGGSHLTLAAFSAKQDKLNIYSLINPQNTSSAIDTNGLKQAAWLLWSPQNNYLVISNRIYSQAGKLLTSLDNTEIWQKSLFSEDEKKLLVMYYKNSPAQQAKLVDLEKMTVSEVKLPVFLSEPILWQE